MYIMWRELLKKTNFWSSRLILFKRSKYFIWLIWGNQQDENLLSNFVPPQSEWSGKKCEMLALILSLINWPVPFYFRWYSSYHPSVLLYRGDHSNWYLALHNMQENFLFRQRSCKCLLTLQILQKSQNTEVLKGNAMNFEIQVEFCSKHLKAWRWIRKWNWNWLFQFWTALMSEEN